MDKKKLVARLKKDTEKHLDESFEGNTARIQAEMLSEGVRGLSDEDAMYVIAAHREAIVLGTTLALFKIANDDPGKFIGMATNVKAIKVADANMTTLMAYLDEVHSIDLSNEGLDAHESKADS